MRGDRVTLAALAPSTIKQLAEVPETQIETTDSKEDSAVPAPSRSAVTAFIHASGES